VAVTLTRMRVGKRRSLVERNADLCQKRVPLTGRIHLHDFAQIPYSQSAAPSPIPIKGIPFRQFNSTPPDSNSSLKTRSGPFFHRPDVFWRFVCSMSGVATGGSLLSARAILFCCSGPGKAHDEGECIPGSCSAHGGKFSMSLAFGPQLHPQNVNWHPLAGMYTTRGVLVGKSR
jgi:hypothetical protein